MSTLNNYISELCRCLQSLNDGEIKAAIALILNTIVNDGTIYLLGNGGSAATVSHWACDFQKTLCSVGEKRVKVVSLCESASLITAYANDNCFEDVFLLQIQGRLSDKDLIIVLSASGNSENLIRALQYGTEIGAKRVSIVGNFGGRAIELSNCAIVVDSHNYGIIEDIHLALNHLITFNLKDLITR